MTHARRPRLTPTQLEAKRARDRLSRQKATPEQREARRVRNREHYRANPERQRLASAKWRVKPGIKAKRAAALKPWKIKNAERLRELRIKYHLTVRRKRPWVPAVRYAKYRARDRGVDYDLAREWAIARYTGCCELTGIPFSVSDEVPARAPSAFACSIDRVDQREGYTQKNCRFVLFCVNVMRGSLNDEEMMTVARALVQTAGAHQ